MQTCMIFFLCWTQKKNFPPPLSLIIQTLIIIFIIVTLITYKWVWTFVSLCVSWKKTILENIFYFFNPSLCWQSSTFECRCGNLRILRHGVMQSRLRCSLHIYDTFHAVLVSATMLNFRIHKQREHSLRKQNWAICCDPWSTRCGTGTVCWSVSHPSQGLTLKYFAPLSSCPPL